MRSKTGFFAALVLLLALPITVLYQGIFKNGADTVVHLVLAAGAMILAFAVFDFRKVARWIIWLGCLAAAAEGTIFLMQGVSHLIQNPAFTDLVYQKLGQWPERLFLDLIIVWLIVLWRAESQGKTRYVGLAALIAVVGLEIYSYSLLWMGSSINAVMPGLKLLYLLPFVWLLLESIKKASPSFNNPLILTKETP
jgi:hypothetical protein